MIFLARPVPIVQDVAWSYYDPRGREVLIGPPGGPGCSHSVGRACGRESFHYGAWWPSVNTETTLSLPTSVSSTTGALLSSLGW